MERNGLRAARMLLLLGALVWSAPSAHAASLVLETSTVFSDNHDQGHLTLTESDGRVFNGRRNPNYIVGSQRIGTGTGFIFHNYFFFDTAALTGFEVLGAALELQAGTSGNGGQASVDYSLHSVERDAADFFDPNFRDRSQQDQLDIFFDLANGELYGSYSLPTSPRNQNRDDILSLGLNEAAVAGLNIAGEGLFGLGGNLPAIAAGSLDYFGGTNDFTARLVLDVRRRGGQEVPEPSSVALLGFGLLAAARRRRARAGSRES